MNALMWLAWVLVVVGALNWGLVGLFNFDLVAAIFGDMSGISRVIYVLVGLGAIVMVATTPKMKTGM